MMWLVRRDDPIRPPDDGAGSVLDGFEMGDQVGNPLYTVIDEHALAAVTLIVLPLLL